MTIIHLSLSALGVNETALPNDTIGKIEVGYVIVKDISKGNCHSCRPWTKMQKTLD